MLVDAGGAFGTHPKEKKFYLFACAAAASRCCDTMNERLERAAMKAHEGVIKGTAREIMAQLAHVPPGERVRLMIGRPSLTVIARRLQATAAANGMTTEIHNDLLGSLKNAD